MENRRAFGVLFAGVSAAVLVGAVLSELAFQIDAPIYYYAAIWLGSFGATFGAVWSRFKRALPSIRSRMKNSVRWSQGAKVLNAVCWSAPFAGIALFPELYQYLILLGIGLGNMATYTMMKKYSGLDNKEQLIVAAIALAALPVAYAMDTSVFVARQDIAVMLSRILISLAYGAGGMFALFARD